MGATISAACRGRKNLLKERHHLGSVSRAGTGVPGAAPVGRREAFLPDAARPGADPP